MKIIKPSFEVMTPLVGHDMLEHVERCGRTCYQSERRITANSAVGFVRGIINNGHESVLEHVTLTVKVICDRAVANEIVRHRIASYSQESTRYCSYKNELTVIDLATGFQYDLACKADMLKYDCWQRAMKASEDYYNEMIMLGAAPEEARSVLTLSTKTEIVMTYNLRQWRHFFRLRAAGESGRPHPQMCEWTIPLLKFCKEKIPVVFDDIMQDGEK